MCLDKNVWQHYNNQGACHCASSRLMSSRMYRFAGIHNHFGCLYVYMTRASPDSLQRHCIAGISQYACMNNKLYLS